MKATKKIIPALVMLLVSAILLSTASYAWFSMNTTVTATGMQVKVKAPTSLLISNTNATEGFGSTVALTNDTASAATEFAPVAYSGEAESWYKLTAEAMANIDQDGRAVGFTEVQDGQPVDSFTDAKVDTKDVYEDGSKHVFHDTVWLKVEGENDQKVTATLKYITPPADEIKSAMHVVFVVGSEVKATVDMGEETLTTDELASLTANAAATQIDIYYFLSGNDDDCKNTNISEDATMSIDITFNASGVTSGGEG